MSKAISDDRPASPFVFETLKVHQDGAVLLTEINAPPMKFPAAGHVVVKERVNAIALPTVEDICRDSDLFLAGTRTNEYQQLMQAAMKRGFQTREAEMDLARLVSDLDEPRSDRTDHPA